MKLRTEIRDNRLGCQGMYVDPDNIEWFQSSCVYDDAMYAHALLRALRQAPDMDYQRKWIIGRADELMTQWGFVEGMP